MNGGSSASKPDSISAAEGQSRLRSAGFERLFVGRPPKRHELWQNKYKKVVQVQYSDVAYEAYWAETIDEALKHRESHLKTP